MESESSMHVGPHWDVINPTGKHKNVFPKSPIKKGEIKLICKSVWYYSQIDEALFFEWIKRIKSITHVDGTGDELYLHFKSKKLPDNDLRELIALFYKYKLDMKQLHLFLNDKNRDWFFGKPKGYWHKRIFG